MQQATSWQRVAGEKLLVRRASCCCKAVLEPKLDKVDYANKFFDAITLELTADRLILPRDKVGHQQVWTSHTWSSKRDSGP